MGRDSDDPPRKSLGDVRVLVVSGLYPKPGAASSGVFIHRQIKELRSQGLDARVLCPVARTFVSVGNNSRFGARLDGPRDCRIEGVPVTYVPYRHIPHKLSTRLEALSLVHRLRDVRNVMFDSRPDLVHGHWLFPAGYAALDLASGWEVPSVVSARGSDVHRYPDENRGFARFVRTVLRRADCVTAVSEALAGEIRDRAGAELEVRVVRNGVDPGCFRPTHDRSKARRDLGVPEDGIGICSVAALVEAKGVNDLVQAFRRLTAQGHDVWLALVGDGPLLDNLRSAAQGEGWGDKLHLPGQVPPSEVSGWMQASDIFALLSYAEGLPNVVLEAMACGLPIVATEVGGIPEVVDQEVGRLVPPRRPDAVTARMKELVADPALRRRLGDEARRRIEKEFTWHRSAEELVGVYRDVLEDGGQSGEVGDSRVSGEERGTTQARRTT